MHRRLSSKEMGAQIQIQVKYGAGRGGNAWRAEFKGPDSDLI